MSIKAIKISHLRLTMAMDETGRLRIAETRITRTSDNSGPAHRKIFSLLGAHRA